MFKLLHKWQEQGEKYAERKQLKAHEILKQFAVEFSAKVNCQIEDDKVAWREEARRRDEAAAAKLAGSRQNLRSRERGAAAPRGKSVQGQEQQKKLAEQVCELQAVIAAQDERHQDETQV